jgi:hypothetical protein
MIVLPLPGFGVMNGIMTRIIVLFQKVGIMTEIIVKN